MARRAATAETRIAVGPPGAGRAGRRVARSVRIPAAAASWATRGADWARSFVRPAAFRGRSTVDAWGRDGLAEHPFAAVGGVRDWSDVSLDELVLLVPALENGGATRLETLSTLIGDALRRHSVAAAALASASDRIRHQAVTTVLGRLLYAARASEATPFEAGGRPRAEAEPALAEVLVASIAACVNGAYVYHGCAFAHELLATGAWLGHVARRRPAWMPCFVAECLTDYIKDGAEPALDPDDGDRSAVCGAILRWHADASIGADALLAAAWRVRETGRVELVRPVSNPAASPPPPPIVVWNASLFASVEQG